MAVRTRRSPTEASWQRALAELLALSQLGQADEL
jgi:hypothetical protein